MKLGLSKMMFFMACIGVAMSWLAVPKYQNPAWNREVLPLELPKPPTTFDMNGRSAPYLPLGLSSESLLFKDGHQLYNTCYIMGFRSTVWRFLNIDDPPWQSFDDSYCDDLNLTKTKWTHEHSYSAMADGRRAATKLIDRLLINQKPETLKKLLNDFERPYNRFVIPSLATITLLAVAYFLRLKNRKLTSNVEITNG